jgi:hypothetical protein
MSRVSLIRLADYKNLPRKGAGNGLELTARHPKAVLKLVRLPLEARHTEKGELSFVLEDFATKKKAYRGRQCRYHAREARRKGVEQMNDSIEIFKSWLVHREPFMMSSLRLR